MTVAARGRPSPRRPSTGLPGALVPLAAVAVLFLVVPVVGLLVLHQLWTSVPRSVLLMILLGGLVYSGGVIFHLSLRRYSRALWHGCVLVGATFHYFAIASLIAA